MICRIRIAYHLISTIFGSLVFLSPIDGISQLSSASVQTRSVASSDGVRIVYDVRGQGSVALVFVHCWAGNRYFWRNQAASFSEQYRVVTLDLAGHGESGKNRKNWTVLGLAKDVVAVANDLELQKIVLIGHSMGGPVCLQAATELPGRVVGIILADTMHDVSQRRTVAAAQADADQLKRDFKGYFHDLSALFSKTSDPAVRHWVETQAMAADPNAIIALKLDTPNVVPSELFERAGVRIRAINAIPPLSDRTDVEVNRRFADYDVAFVSDAGHFLQLEQPQEFNDDLRNWILELTQGSPR
ncbi:MAG: alpha/beta hydrolase [Chthoniobacterales bacterium]